jgi:lysophospholipase L1-like esterase
MARGSGRLKKICFSLMTLVLFLLIAEGILWIAGADTGEEPEDRDASEDIYEPFDERVFVQLKKNTTYKPYPVTYSPYYDVALRGNREYGPKDENTVRIICLGDSCTYLSVPAYPELAEKELALRSGGPAYEVINGGIRGLSSFWGFQLLKHALIDMSPDIVTVYFGWNDHWSSAMRDKTGREVALKERHVKFLKNLMRRSRLYHGLKNMMLPARKENEIPYQETLFRKVPLDDFHENLRNIISLSRSKGARVLLITPPHGLDIKDIPSFLLPLGKVSTREELVALHESYIRAVRSVAAEQKTALLDLAAAFEDKGREPLFKDDGIHLSPEGLAAAASLLAGKIIEMTERPS